MNFRKQVRYNTSDRKNLLDPKVCMGENLIPNILTYLGVNEQLARNPVV